MAVWSLVQLVISGQTLSTLSINVRLDNEYILNNFFINIISLQPMQNIISTVVNIANTFRHQLLYFSQSACSIS